MMRPKISYRFDRRRPPPDVLERRNREIVEMRSRKISFRAIAKDFGLAESVVRRIVGRAQANEIH